MNNKGVPAGTSFFVECFELRVEIYNFFTVEDRQTFA